MAQDGDSKKLILAKRKTISALLPYAISLERGGDQTMSDAVLLVARASCSHEVVWDRILPYITALFNEPVPSPLDRLITFFSPYLPWDRTENPEGFVFRWAAAVLATPYTEQVGQSVVDALLQIASFYHLRPYIPRDVWALLKKRPFIPFYCPGKYQGTSKDVVRHIRGLGDTEILKSYLLLVWSEWSLPLFSCHWEMLVSIREDFGQVGTRHHREDLVGRLDCILENLGQSLELFEEEGLECLYRYYIPGPSWISDPQGSLRICGRNHVLSAMYSYEKLREELLKEGEAENIVTGLSPNLTHQQRALTVFHAFFTAASRLWNALLTKIFACILSM